MPSDGVNTGLLRSQAGSQQFYALATGMHTAQAVSTQLTADQHNIITSQVDFFSCAVGKCQQGLNRARSMLAGLSGGDAPTTSHHRDHVTCRRLLNRRQHPGL